MANYFNVVNMEFGVNWQSDLSSVSIAGVIWEVCDVKGIGFY